MATVRITLDLPVSKLADLQVFLADVPEGYLTPNPQKTKPAPKAQESGQKPAEPKVQESDQKSAEPEPEEPKKITKTMIRSLGVQLTKEGRQDEIAAVFSKFGVSALSQLKESDYAEVYKLLGGE